MPSRNRNRNQNRNSGGRSRETSEQAQISEKIRKAITVRVGKLPGVIQDVMLNGERTVAAAIEEAEIDAGGYEVRVNGEPAEEDKALRAGDTLLLVRTIEGN